MTNRYEQYVNDLAAQMKIWEEPEILAEASHAAIKLWTAAKFKDSGITGREADDAFLNIRRAVNRVKYILDISINFLKKGVVV